MEKDIERLKVIDNIKSNIKENKLNSKVEINDETITEEDRKRVVYKFDILRKNPINKVKKVIARNIANNFTDNINQDTEIIGLENVKDVLQSFLGKSKQVPPMYSAIKVNGQKLYDLARKGIKVEREERNIEITNIELLKIEDECNIKEITFRVVCSKGTYIRVLCENIAEKLGTVRLYEISKENKNRTI